MARARQKTGIRKIFFWGIAIAILVFIIIPLITLASISDSRALVEEVATVDTNSAIKAKKAAKRLYKDLMAGKSDQRSTLTFSEDEINGIVALGTRGVKSLKGRVNVTPLGIMGAFTLNLPDNPLGEYINLTITILPSSKGLVVDNVSVGSIDISGNMAISLMEIALNKVIAGDTFGTKLINAIDSVEVDHSTLVLAYHSIPGFRNAIDNTKERIKEVRDDLALLGDPKLVKIYYERICKFHSQIDGFGQASVGYYLDTAFSFAEKRSYMGKAPVEENRAALMALAIFLGSSKFDSVVGALDEETLDTCQPRNSQMVLANRNDLRLHFIFSAALKVISDSGMSFTIGEFKELLDSQPGGSGFSFADLAADRAGIRFAEMALDENGALRVQQIASELRQEKAFFPSIAGLPEGIPQQVFDERGGIEGDFYKQHLATINQRIDRLALYKAH
ncbi:MAG: hypothetical protein GY807_06035 [Gammaproteobacteria bacterium]|nr:hypothetical protein [Gammaproteobacteria bacterium]